MESKSENFNRASSLPPSCVKYENHICELNLSFEEPSNQNIHDTTKGIHQDMDEFTSYRQNVHDPSEFILHSVKVSPSDSSAITDEDSGYFQTNSTSSRQVGSSTSIAVAGQLNYDGNCNFVNRDELLQVMTEDLVDWFIQMYPTQTEELTVDNFFDRLSDGVLLCYHVTELHQRLTEHCEVSVKGGKTYLTGVRVGGSQAMLPNRCPIYQTRGLNNSNATSAFVSRDNVANFLAWCRQLGMPDSVLFESEDLVCRKNPRNVAVCLLELARLGGGVGMAVPELIQLEVEIDEELACECYNDSPSLSEQSCHAHSSSCSSITDQIHTIYLRRKSEGGHRSIDAEADGSIGSNACLGGTEMKSQPYRTTRSTELRRLKNKRLSNTARSTELTNGKHSEDVSKKKTETQRPVVDMRSLDEIVRELLSQCTCKQTFPMIRVSEGRYLFGDKCTQIFVRILRNHVMVRVGGGWDTLNHFLKKYDECRKVNPPNYRVANDLYTNSTTPRVVDTENPEAMLRVLDVTDNVAPLPQNSPIRGQGKLSAVKKSPPLEETLAAEQSNKSCTSCMRDLKEPNGTTVLLKEESQTADNKPKSNTTKSKMQFKKTQQSSEQSNSIKSNQPRTATVKDTKSLLSTSDFTKSKLIENKEMKNPTANASITWNSRIINVQQPKRLPTSALSSDQVQRADGQDRNGVQCNAPANTKAKSYNRYKPSTTSGNRRLSMAQRALASAPRTPSSNRSRTTSPVKLHSAFSKSSSSLVPCSTTSEEISSKGAVSQPRIQSSPRRSERSDLLPIHSTDLSNGSNKAKSKGSKPAPVTAVTSKGNSNNELNKTIQLTNKTTISNQTVNTLDIPLHQQPSSSTEQPHARKTERRASLIPRLIRCRSTSRSQTTNAQEYNFVQDL